MRHAGPCKKNLEAENLQPRGWEAVHLLQLKAPGGSFGVLPMYHLALKKGSGEPQSAIVGCRPLPAAFCVLTGFAAAPRSKL